MRAAVIAALICCLSASARSQDILPIVREQLNGPAVQNILSKVPEQEQCRSNAGTFIRSCTEDLISTTGLKDDTSAVIGLVSIDQAANSLKIKGNALAGYIDGATASDACCKAACEVAKKGCMCQADAWNEMRRTFSLDGDNGVFSVFNKIVGKCSTGSRSFETVMDPGSASCSKDNIPKAKAFTC
ncbi:hypothetical protein BSKO_06864 [Bryopsis sp. KO-2023]|nr:hypothetical protein BSKO_06864 [Bryopsis sp. KO-2023]